MTSKQSWALLTASIGASMCFIFIFTLDKNNKDTKIDIKLIEMETASLKDFSVQGEIPVKMYEAYLRASTRE